MRLLLISSFALLFTLAQGTGESGGETPAMVLSYSSDASMDQGRADPHRVLCGN